MPGQAKSKALHQLIADDVVLGESVRLSPFINLYGCSVGDESLIGAFVEIQEGQDGLCHISELDDAYVRSVGDVVKVGDEVRVKVIAIDDQGRVKLSRKAAMKEEKAESEASE